ncbi:MAG: hypothetical protein ACRDLT_15725, partial [Solirubrobacteraceae bacterium]
IGAALAALPDPGGRRLPAIAGHFAAAARPGHIARAGEYALLAARQALTQLAFEQAATLAERGLRCLAIDGGDASALRCDLWMLLAQGRLLAREIEGCKQAAIAAGEDARALGDGEALARAAVIGSHLNTFGQPSADLRLLLADALAVRGELDPAAAAQILAGQADYLAASEGDAPGAEPLSCRALELARACGDPRAHARALFVHAEVLEWSPRTRERLALADELEQLAREHGDLQVRANAHHVRALALLANGRLAAFDRELEQVDRLRPRLAYWYTDVYVLLWRGMRALLDGRFEEVTGYLDRLLAYAQHEPNVVNLYTGQLFCLYREQRRLAELVPAIELAVTQNPNLPVFRCALALAHAESGQLPQAAEQLRQIEIEGLAAIPRDSTWTTSLVALSDTVATLADATWARALLPLVQPYSGALLAATKGMACLGAADRLLGRLHLVLGEPEQADRHFEAALALERETGSELLLARTERDQRRRALA